MKAVVLLLGERSSGGGWNESTFCHEPFTSEKQLFATISRKKSHDDSHVLPYPNAWLIPKSITEMTGTEA